jgi:hypothetical protein
MATLPSINNRYTLILHLLDYYHKMSCYMNEGDFIGLIRTGGFRGILSESSPNAAIENVNLFFKV